LRGTGLSSFACLKNLSVEYLKIDGTFVRDIVNDPISFALVKSSEADRLGDVTGRPLRTKDGPSPSE
jgi:predicted signal transduction protein with EAL and GGDEF domain